MKNLSTILGVFSIVLDVAIAVMGIITIRYVVSNRKEK